MTDFQHDIAIVGAGFCGMALARTLAQCAPSGTRVALIGTAEETVYAETKALFKELSEMIGVLQFIRSGRIAINKSKVERLSDMLALMEKKKQEKEKATNE